MVYIARAREDGACSGGGVARADRTLASGIGCTWILCARR